MTCSVDNDVTVAWLHSTRMQPDCII